MSVNANHGRPNMTRSGSRLHQTLKNTASSSRLRQGRDDYTRQIYMFLLLLLPWQILIPQLICAPQTLEPTCPAVGTAYFSITCFTSSMRGASTSMTRRSRSSRPLNSGGSTSRSKLKDGEPCRARVTASENLAGCAVDSTICRMCGGLRWCQIMAILLNEVTRYNSLL